jgi:Putative DNA-binding domain
MTTLAQLQRHFQANVLHGDEKMLALVIGTQEVQTATRLSIYSEGYRLRLIDALASNVPRLQQLLGEQEFATLAQRYIDACPSSYRSIRWFGDQLAQSLEHWHAEEPWLAELARWEWTIAAAFDAGDAPILGEAAIGALAPEAWPELTLQFHPSMHCLRTRTNAPALCKALADDSAPPPPAMLDNPQSWLIWRQALTTQFRSLSKSEAATLDLMRAGGTFEAMCTLLCDWHDAQQVPMLAAGTLRQWIADGLLTGMGNAGADASPATSP